jgi:cell wall assembly regulator SMI1
LTLLRLHFFILAFSDDYWLPCGAGHDRVVNAQPEYEDVYTQVIDFGKIPAELSPNPEDAVGQLIDFVLIPP